jgi:2',3'-cyclic-nucleotide 2'-phosphodiesterase (5'-nucleotidase family)
MMHKKRSWFARCCRLLALSLLPALVISCAADDDDNNSSSSTPAPTPDTTAPTVSLNVSEGDTLLGTSTFTLTFSEAVTGVAGNPATGTCEGTVRLVASTDTSTCLALEITGSGSSYVVDPEGEINDGGYTLTLGTGITDTAGNALAEAVTVNFSVSDVLSTVLNQLELDLISNADLTPTEAATITAAARSEATNNNENNDLLAVLPEALSGATVTIIANHSGAEQEAALRETVRSLMSNVDGATSLTTARSLRVAALGDTQNFPALLSALGRAVAIDGSSNDTAFGVLTAAVISNLDDAGASAAQIADNNYVGDFVDETVDQVILNAEAASQQTLLETLATSLVTGINALTDLSTAQKNSALQTQRESLLSKAAAAGLNDTAIGTALSVASLAAGLDDGSADGGDGSDNETDSGDNETVTVTRGAFTLQLLHFSDVNGDERTALDNLDEFSSLVNAFRSDSTFGDNTLFVNSGGYLDPYSLRFTAPADNSTVTSAVSSSDNGSADVAILNALGVEAVTISPNEFENGTSSFLRAIDNDTAADNVTAVFPHIVSNVDFNVGLGFTLGQDGAYASQQAKSMVNYSVVSVDSELIGLVGVASPDLDNVSHTDNLTISPDADTSTATAAQIAAAVQPTVDILRDVNINKIVLLSSLQDLGVEKALAAALYDVDIIVAGGSRARMGDSDDVLYSGSFVTDSAFDETYPHQTTDLEGNPVLVVNVDGDYKYLGRLVVDFDNQGVIQTSYLDSALNGAYASTATVAANAGGSASTAVTSLQSALQSWVNPQYATSQVVGYDNVSLDGSAVALRTQDTDLGNLIAKSYRWYADNVTSLAIDAAFKESRNIRNGFAADNITEQEIQSALPENDSLVVLQLTAQELKNTLEHSVALTSSTATPGRFLQVSGLRFSYDLSDTTAKTDNGSDNGSRVTTIELMYDNGTRRAYVYDNATFDNASATYRIVTTKYLADGGDLFPLTALDNASRIDLDNGSYAVGVNNSSFRDNGTEQEAFAEYLQAFHDNTTTAITADSFDNYTRITDATD